MIDIRCRLNHVVRVTKNDKSKKLLSVRCVFTEKSKEEGIDPIGWGLKAKARLVVKGFMDPGKGSVPTDSPTMRREMLRILAWLSVQNKFVPRKYDIKTAFLNAKMPRDIQIRPPPEAHVPEGMVWSLERAAYGLVDAPREWFLTLQKFLRSLPLVQSRYDPCVWWYFEEVNGKRKLPGMIGTHVDDCYVAGNKNFEDKVITPLKSKFNMGHAMKGEFTYCGIHVTHDSKDDSITLDQNEYIDSIEDVDIPENRWKEEDSSCSADELTIFRGKLGELMWVSGQTRPDLAMMTSHLPTRVSDLRIHDLAMAQAAVQKAKEVR